MEIPYCIVKGKSRLGTDEAVRVFGIGGALPPKKDLHRFIRWPQVVRIQRKRRILKQGLKVPPALNQITKTLVKNLDCPSAALCLTTIKNEDKIAIKWSVFL